MELVRLKDSSSDNHIIDLISGTEMAMLLDNGHYRVSARTS